METTYPWNRQISLIQVNQPLDRQYGFAQLVDGRIFYSPNCNRTISTPSSITDPNELKDLISEVQNPYWWNQKIPYLAFIPRNPRYTNIVPFQHLSRIPHQHDVCPEGKRMPLEVQGQWTKLEQSLVKATHRLMVDLGIEGVPPPRPTSMGYTGKYSRLADLKWALGKSKESFSLWIGALAFAIALSSFTEPPDTILPRWCSSLQAAGLSEIWVDGLRTSPMMRFDDSILRVGVALDILSPQAIQASVDWLCRFNIPVWYPWGTQELAAASNNPNITRLAPHPYQLQNLSSFRTKEVGVNSPPNFFQASNPFPQHDSQLTNKRPFDKSITDVPTINKRPRHEEPQPSSSPRVPWTTTEPNPWGTTKPNPWGNVSWPVFPEPPSNVSVPERPVLPPQPNLTTNVASWEPFFACCKERNERIRKSESAKDKQRRENWERIPPTSKTNIYEWEKNDEGLYTRVRVTKSEFEDCFERHGKFQRRYDSFRNEWDMCEDFGPLDDCQIAQNMDDAAEMFDMLPEVYISKTVEQAITAQLASIDQARADAGGDRATPIHHAEGEIDAPIPAPEAPTTNSLVEVSEIITSTPGNDLSIPSQVGMSVGDRARPIFNITEEIEAPSQPTSQAPPVSTLETPTTNPIPAQGNPLPQVDSSVSPSGLGQDHTMISTIAHNPPLQVNLSLSSSGTISTVAAVCPQVDLPALSPGVDWHDATISTNAHDSLQIDLSVLSHLQANLSVSSSGIDQEPATISTVAAVDNLHPQVASSAPSSGVDQGHAKGLDDSRNKDESVPLVGAPLLEENRNLAFHGHEDGQQQVDEGLFEQLYILREVYGFVLPTLATPNPSTTIDGAKKKHIQVSVGLGDDDRDFSTSPFALPALNFLDRLADATPHAETHDLAEENPSTLQNFDRLQKLSRVGNLYVFDFKSEATLPWMIGVTSAAVALYIVRLDPRYNDYEVSRCLLHRGVAFHTVLPLRRIPKSPFPDTIPSSTRSPGYQFTVDDFNAYVHRRDSLLRTPRGRAALLKGGIVWRLAEEVIGIDECLEGPSVETLVHRRGHVYPTADPSFDLCDDDLSTVELDIICGVYTCFTGKLPFLTFLCAPCLTGIM